MTDFCCECGNTIESCTCNESEQHSWISVKDRLPEITRSISSDKVIIAMGVKDKQILFGWYKKIYYDDNGVWVTSDNKPFIRQDLITHWMPLPSKPTD